MSTRTKMLKVKEKEIEYGQVEMTDEEYLESQNPKIRTTIFLDADLIRAYKKKAIKQGVKYQQLIRETLRNALVQESDVEGRLDRLEKVVYG